MNRKFEIMVVDDNLINLKLASDLLEIDGFKVYKYEDAESAMDALKHIHPDLILMDVALPGMDGLQLTRILKSTENTKDIKIIAVTAFAMKGDMEKIMAAGCDGYISKPIDTRKFKEQILQYL
jgi:two-component system cell cycle response regulator DivK